MNSAMDMVVPVMSTTYLLVKCLDSKPVSDSDIVLMIVVLGVLRVWAHYAKKEAGDHDQDGTGGGMDMDF